TVRCGPADRPTGTGRAPWRPRAGGRQVGGRYAGPRRSAGAVERERAATGRTRNGPPGEDRDRRRPAPPGPAGRSPSATAHRGPRCAARAAARARPAPPLPRAGPYAGERGRRWSRALRVGGRHRSASVSGSCVAPRPERVGEGGVVSAWDGAAVEVGEGPGDAQGPVDPAGADLAALHRPGEDAAGRIVHREGAAQVGPGHLRVGPPSGALEPGGRPCPGPGDPDSDGRRLL